jgi:lysophospholipase L1-like esterase
MHMTSLRAFRCFYGLISLLLAHAACAGTPLLPHVAQRIATHQTLHITAFGSSSTEGVGATSRDRCYPARLQAVLANLLPAEIGVAVLNRGVGGEDVDDMIARLPAIIAEKPDLVVWQTGSNDALRSVKLAHFISATSEGITRMRQAGIDVMLMEPQLSQRLAQTGTSDEFLGAVRELGRVMHVEVIRRYDLMRQWLASGRLTYRQMMSDDGLHMTDGGYDLLATALAATIIADSLQSTDPLATAAALPPVPNDTPNHAP